MYEVADMRPLLKISQMRALQSEQLCSMGGAMALIFGVSPASNSK